MQALLFSPFADEAAVLTLVLQQAGFSVRSVRSLDQAIEAWPEQPPDLIMVTVDDDRQKSIKHIEQIRMFSATPICVISDLVAEDTQVALYDGGTDLLVLRPYSVRVLLAQIKALLRSSSGVPFFSLPTLSQLDVSLDPSTRMVQVGELPPKRLTQLEFRLLYTLMTHPGQIIPTDKIVEHVWGYTGGGNRKIVRGLVQRLRSKVEPDPKNPRYIQTELGIGYYFNRFLE